VSFLDQKENEVNKKRMLILANVTMMTYMATLDGSIVNVALPTMAQKLNVPEASIAWVVSAYLIVISATILIFGRLGDIKGNTKIFKAGIVVFTIGSLLCGLSNSLSTLIMARVIQGIGAAAFMATNQGIITQIFPEKERGRALGISGMTVALGTMSGPPIGGFVVSFLSWKTIFLINVPIGIIVFIISLKILKQKAVSSNEVMDIKGSFLFSFGTLTLFLILNFAERLGFKSPIIIIGIAIGTIIISIFFLVEKKTIHPLLELNLFKNKLFSLSIFCAFLSFIVIATSNIILPFYLQNVMKITPSKIGWIMMVYPLVYSFVAPISGYLSDKIGSEILTFIGLCVTTCGVFLLSTVTQSSQILVIIAFIAIMALGNGLFQAPNASLVMSCVTPDKLGITGSLNGLVRNYGMVFGIVLSTALLYNRMSHFIGYHVSNYVPGRDDVFLYGMKFVYMGATIISLFGALLTGYRLFFYKNKDIDKHLTNHIL
jgi:EmrB/QacA subfamily drug resistance transporter